MSLDTVVRGDDKEIEFTIFNPALGTIDDLPARIDLDGATVHFWARRNEVEPESIIKTSTLVTEIEIYDQTGSTVGQGKVFLVPADTLSLEAGVYIFEIRVVDSLGKVQSAIRDAFFLARERVEIP